LDNLVDAPDICQFRKAWKARFSGPQDWAIDPILQKYNIDCEG